MFMSSNQIGGFFNRLEASRKYLFGSVGVLGENNASIISGVLILRGQDAKPVVDCAPDYESYEYKKLDVFENQDDKTFFEGALAWDLEVNGKKWADGKNVSAMVLFLHLVLLLTFFALSLSKKYCRIVGYRVSLFFLLFLSQLLNYVLQSDYTCRQRVTLVSRSSASLFGRMKGKASVVLPEIGCSWIM